MLNLPRSVYDELRRHGVEAYPHECCGVLLGEVDADADRREVRELVRCGNTRTDAPHNRYNIAPRELIAAQRRAREQGWDIVGFYHSHPDHPAQCSSTDLDEAHWLGCSYVITSVEEGAATVTNSFVLQGTSEESKRLEPEPLEVEKG